MTARRPCPWRRAGLAGLTVAALGLTAVPAAASPAATTTTTTTRPGAAVTIPSPGAGITGLQLNAIDQQFLTGVQAQVGSAQQALALAQLAVQAATARDAAVGSRLAADQTHLAQLDAGQKVAARAVEDARARLKRLAVAAYESGGPGGPVDVLLRAETIGDLARRQTYFTDVQHASAAALTGYVAARRAISRDAFAAVNAVQQAQSAKALAGQQLLAARAAAGQAAAVLEDRQALLTLTSDALSTPNTDIPRMVLDAYQRAAIAVQAQGCQLSWWGLAGIGRVESDHGRAENAHLSPNGDLTPPIIGVPLTGSNGTALVTDANGAYARAEGPMQFIPSTWARWGADGNGDGVKNVDNIYDAAVGAARYLCATSTQLQADAGLQAAYMSYNHSADYVTEVLAFAHSYELADADGLIPPLSPTPLYTVAPPQPPPPGA